MTLFSLLTMTAINSYSKYIPMKNLLFLFLLITLAACQNNTANTPDIETFNRPAFVNFEYIDAQVDRPGRRLEAYQATIELLRVGAEETVVLAKDLESASSTAYVLAQAAADNIESRDFERGWIVFLQDHLLVISEDGREKLKFSVADRPFDSPAIGESASFTETYSGYGLARYGEQAVTKAALQSANSYLEARSQIE